MIHFHCPKCNVRLKGLVASAGHKGRCPICGRRFRVPVRAGAAAGEPGKSGGSSSLEPQVAGPAGSTGAGGGPGGSSVVMTVTADALFGDYTFLAPPEGPGEIGRLGPYRVLEVLGTGSSGIVFRAEDPQLRRPAALKALRPGPAASAESRRRFLREARATAAIDHDHVLTIYQVGEDRGVPWLAMKLLRGGSLKDRLNGPDQRLPAAQALRIGAEVADALAAAHATGLIHRDVKPSNILLEEGTDRVKLIDFGLALVDDGEGHLTRLGCVVGTPAYMAPEQADGAPVDPRCDLYGLGCVLYRSCTGRLPFEGHSAMDVFFAQRTETPTHPCAIEPSIPPAFGDLIVSLLARDPGDRPQSAAAARDALRALQAGPPPDARPWPAAPTVETATRTREEPAPQKPAPAPAPANPWADVVSGPPEGSAARSASTSRASLARRWGGSRLRWLAALLAASLGLLLFLIVLGLLRH